MVKLNAWLGYFLLYDRPFSVMSKYKKQVTFIISCYHKSTKDILFDVSFILPKCPKSFSFGISLLYIKKKLQKHHLVLFLFIIDPKYRNLFFVLLLQLQLLLTLYFFAFYYKIYSPYIQFWFHLIKNL